MRPYKSIKNELVRGNSRVVIQKCNMRRTGGGRKWIKVLLSLFFMYIVTWDSLSGIITNLAVLPGAEAKRKEVRRELHIGGIFPINGTGGWQGGQVSDSEFN